MTTDTNPNACPTKSSPIEEWRAALHAFARDLCEDFRTRPGVRGVAIGGSLARGAEWEHSDVEIGLVVDERIADIGHFNVRDGRGFEVFQLQRSKWTDKIAQAEVSPLAVVDWPIQLFQCRVIHDDDGLFTRFKTAFDRSLFDDAVVAEKARKELLAFDKKMGAARDNLTSGRPASALVRLREAMNSLVLALYWLNRQLPRSQNRTEARLRELCDAIGRKDIHELFLAVYGIERFDETVAREQLRACRADVDDAAKGWGIAAPAFFRDACDGDFAWGHGRSILAVHRLCIPACVRAGGASEFIFDDPQWRSAHESLVAFLGIDDESIGMVDALVDQATEVRTGLPSTAVAAK